jgi:hypothetical protein
MHISNDSLHHASSQYYMLSGVFQVSTSAAFGTIRTTYPARQVQFALKLMF